MIPPLSAVQASESSAERRVAKLLSEAPLSPAAALYSFHLTQHAKHTMGEIDFLVLFDDAIVAIEVKGGRIAMSDGMWHFTNRFGQTNSKREGPFEQARRGMFAVRDLLDRRVPGVRPGYASLVITPDQPLDPGVEWEREEHVGPAGMSVSGLTQALLRARKSAVQRGRSAGLQGYSDFLAALRPDFEVLPKLQQTADELKIVYVSLRDRQTAVLAGLDSNARILCEGGAGTGKTLLAAEAARRAAEDGSSVIFTCTSPQVVDHVRRLLLETTVRAVPFDELAAAGQGEVLVVDEAQDLMNMDDLQLLDSALVGGLEQGRWRVFCDTNNQAHVRGRYDSEVFREFERWGTIWRLTENVRNTAPIIAQTQAVTGADLGTPRVAAGPRVTSRKVTVSDEPHALDGALEALRDEDVPLDTVAVVSVADAITDSAALRCHAFRSGRLVLAGDRVSSRVARLYTSAQIKGLEADHVCVVDVDSVDDPGARSRLYVAMSRARVSLWVAYREGAWKQIQKSMTKAVRI